MSLVINNEYTGSTNLENMYTIDPATGRSVKLTESAFADSVMKARGDKGPWEVMDLLIEHWSATNPTKYDSYVVSVERKKDSRGTKFGQGKSDSSLRQTLDIPTPVIMMFRSIYKPDDFPFDKKFYYKFWERYPMFRVAERL